MWFGVYNLALNEAERRIDAGTAAMLIQVGPLLVALLAAMFLGERLTPYVVVGIAVAFCGVAVISLANGEGGSGDVWGVVLTVLAAVGYAIGVVAQKPLTARIPPFELILLSCLIGIVSSLPFAGGLADLADASLSTWVWIVYLGVFPTALAFSTWAYALKRMGAARLSITTFLVPRDRDRACLDRPLRDPAAPGLPRWRPVRGRRPHLPPQAPARPGVRAVVRDEMALDTPMSRGHFVSDYPGGSVSSQPRKASRFLVDSPRSFRHSHSLRIDEAKPSSRIVLNEPSA